MKLGKSKSSDSIISVANKITVFVVICSAVFMMAAFVLFYNLDSKISKLELKAARSDVLRQAHQNRDSFYRDIVKTIEDHEFLNFLRAGETSRVALLPSLHAVLLQLPAEICGIEIKNRFRKQQIFIQNMAGCSVVLGFDLFFLGDNFNQIYGEYLGELNLCIDPVMLKGKLTKTIPKIRFLNAGNWNYFDLEESTIFLSRYMRIPGFFFDVQMPDDSNYRTKYYFAILMIFLLYSALIRVVILRLIGRDLIQPLLDMSTNLLKGKTLAINHLKLRELVEIDTALFKLNHFESSMQILAHEIRSPLAKITIFLGILRQKKLNVSSTLDDLLDKFEPSIKLHIASIESLIRDILQLNRKNEPAFASVSIKNLIDKALVGIEEKAKKNAVAIVNSAEADVQVFAEEAKIMRVLINLVNNALTYMDKPGQIHISSLPHSSSHLKIIVENTGSYIPSGAPIFDPFVTLEKRGFGLGLAICKKIVIEHNGEIHWESDQASRVTRFCFTLARP